jgi:type 1 glutamine amidotransferase
MTEILLVTKGHPFEREPFFALFEALPGVGFTHVEQPAAQALFNVRHARRYDAFVLYDMPGIRFQPNREPEFEVPDPQLVADFEELLAAGLGFVFLHHAIAGWPAWERYARIMGGRFLYLPGEFAGRTCQDSGYRHGVTHGISVVGDHPVTRGLPHTFSITDELYLYEVLERDVTPLLRSDHAFTHDRFYSAARVVREGKLFDNEGWTHAPGSNLIGWTRTEGRSRIVYLQCGDDPTAYANEHFRTLVGNAIAWVAQARA